VHPILNIKQYQHKSIQNIVNKTQGQLSHEKGFKTALSAEMASNQHIDASVVEYLKEPSPKKTVKVENGHVETC